MAAAQQGAVNATAGRGLPNSMPLIGSVGQDYVQNSFAKQSPAAAISALQQNYGLNHPLCPPLLGMLDHLGVSRREAHLYVLSKASSMLLHWIKSLPIRAESKDLKDKLTPEENPAASRLEELLKDSFSYLGIPELKQVVAMWRLFLSCMSIKACTLPYAGQGFAGLSALICF